MDPLPVEFSVSARGIATLALNRPDRGNAFDQRMLCALHDRLTALRDDPTVRILVLRGKGKHFCTGADLQELRQLDQHASPLRIGDVIEAVDGFPKPTLAIVRGAAIGGGAGLAVACDVTIADHHAVFSIPEVRFGVVPDAIADVLTRAMGERNFRRYALSGERIGAEEAYRLGLVHRLVSEVDAQSAEDELAEAWLLGGPLAQAATKRMIRDRRVDSGRLRDRPADPTHAELSLSEVREGAAAFREKRKPSWYS